MPSIRIDAGHFSPDTRTLIELFAARHAIDGVSFEEAWPGRVEAVIVSDAREIPVAFIGLDALVKNKRASGRPKDLDDLSYLTQEG